MSIPHLAKQLRALSYPDMMKLTEELSRAILQQTQKCIDPQVLANTLVNVDCLDWNAQQAQENKLLREVFRIKRTMAICKLGNGWDIRIGTLDAGTVQGSDLRAMWPQLLDQIITLHALSK